MSTTNGIDEGRRLLSNLRRQSGQMAILSAHRDLNRWLSRDRVEQLLDAADELASLREKVSTWARAFKVRKVDQEWPALASVIASMERAANKEPPRG